MLKKHKKICRRGLTHLDATPTFKNRSESYETPCICVSWSRKVPSRPKIGPIFTKRECLIIALFEIRVHYKKSHLV